MPNLPAFTLAYNPFSTLLPEWFFLLFKTLQSCLTFLRMKSQFLILAYKALHNLAPAYISKFFISQSLDLLSSNHTNHLSFPWKTISYFKVFPYFSISVQRMLFPCVFPQHAIYQTQLRHYPFQELSLTTQSTVGSLQLFSITTLSIFLWRTFQNLQIVLCLSVVICAPHGAKTL